LSTSSTSHTHHLHHLHQLSLSTSFTSHASSTSTLLTSHTQLYLHHSPSSYLYHIGVSVTGVVTQELLYRS
jgi:hypothetical protein